MNKLEKILSLVDEYITEKHSKKTWEPGKDWVQYAGPYFTSDEYVRSIESLLNTIIGIIIAPFLSLR